MIDDESLKGRKAVLYRRVKNVVDELAATVLRDGRPFEATFALSRDPVPLRDSFGLDRQPVSEGEVWGRTWESGYFRLKATVPAEWKGKAVAAWLDFGGEGLIYSPAGEPLYGITNGSSFTERYAKDVYRLFPACQGGESVELWVEAAANNLFGIKQASLLPDRTDPYRHGTYESRIRRMRLCVYDHEVWQLFLDMRTLLLLYEDLDPRLEGKTVHAGRILNALFAVTQAWKGDPSRASLCRQMLAPELAKKANASALNTTVVGHAHIDTAWLWSLSETRRKVARTFASQLDLIDRYPDYVFGASAPLHHQWIKEDHPALWERIKKAAAAGRWEPQGGMWLEADCNLPSGESLVRQILHGKNFWKDELGVEVRNCWIPDVFGYSASLPQILVRSGIDFFFTHKLAWSKFNPFPHDTFRWKGLDGSEVAVHFPPERTYNSNATPEVLRRAENNYKEGDRFDEFLTLMGLGDGGGGPKEEHVEYAHRSADLEDVPRATLGRADGLFQRILSRKDELAVWDGELYLEFHRGTYTTQAAIKRNNRRLEQQIRTVEALWADLPGLPWPAGDLDEAVKILLLNQFHDIIPGSSIQAVYTESARQFDRAFALLDDLTRRAASALIQPEDGTVTLFHPLSTSATCAVSLPVSFGAFQVLDADGSALPTQVEGGTTVVALRPGSHSYTTVRRGAPLAPATSGPRVPVLENRLIRYTFAEDGTLTGIFDKEAGRELLPPDSRANLFSLYEDTPHNYEAWDIDFYYRDQFLEHARGAGWEPGPSGPVRSSLQFWQKIGGSSLQQTVRLEEGTKALCFETEVEWDEARKLLRVAFPVASRATEAVCEIAWGHARRPTHANTERDFAQFEVCAHRWVDIGDADRGATLLNDSKYGYSVRDNILDLALLRAPLYPDPEADLGHHRFTYVYLPHEGPWTDSEVRARAEVLNRPPVVFEGTSRRTRSDFWLDADGISLEAVKKAEKGEDIILRLVETRGLESRGTLGTTRLGHQIGLTDLMEWNDGALSPWDAPREVTLAPFEIRTYRVKAIMPRTPASPIQ